MNSMAVKLGLSSSDGISGESRSTYSISGSAAEVVAGAAAAALISGIY